MSRSTSRKDKREHSGGHSRGSHHGGGDSHGHEGGGGGGGGGGGKLTKVAFARNQSEAELLQGLLRESGIQSVLRRSGGFDNPEFGGAGPQDVMVPAEVAPRARELLSDQRLESEDEERLEVESQVRAARGEGGDGVPPARRLALWVGLGLLAALIIVWILFEIS